MSFETFLAIAAVSIAIGQVIAAGREERSKTWRVALAVGGVVAIFAYYI